MIAEFEGVRALLESKPLLSGKVVDTAVADDGSTVRGNYLVMFGAGPERVDDGRWGAIPRPGSDQQFSFPVRAVGTDPDAVRLIGEAVLSLVGVKPAVVGRRCDPVTVDFGAAKTDTSVAPPLFFMDMWVEFWSRRA